MPRWDYRYEDLERNICLKGDKMEESWDGCEILQSDVAETPMNKEKMT